MLFLFVFGFDFQKYAMS